ncbi:hypothetical protein [Streptomyces sp. NBC_00568]|uniref:hypothetical protein n=1 Tax=Streptomyces sp. NBC_00568 TaxID=2975779 RepID=UPI002255DDCD|nr:hypothetical protein [Streptomyces sp. NBC_00568]MCX4993426.1 hypothetical protein [Streptomyces sp. NBC_00568]
MATDERPISRADYERVYVLLQAYRVRDLDGSELLWEILHRIHKDDLGGRVCDPEQVVGDEGIAREAQHAAVVLEALMHGKTTISGSTRPVLGICGTPGCPEHTHGALCPSCELKASGS